jgi:hypothetical protein
MTTVDIWIKWIALGLLVCLLVLTLALVWLVVMSEVDRRRRG